jgi:hypothetical protein
MKIKSQPIINTYWSKDACVVQRPSTHFVIDGPSNANSQLTPREASCEREAEIASPLVEIYSAKQAKRRSANWIGMKAEVVQATSSERIEFHFCAPVHLLILFEQGARREGETTVEGERSSLGDTERKFTFVRVIAITTGMSRGILLVSHSSISRHM